MYWEVTNTRASKLVQPNILRSTSLLNTRESITSCFLKELETTGAFLLLMHVRGSEFRLGHGSQI